MTKFKKGIFVILAMIGLSCDSLAEDIDLFASGLVSGAAAAAVPNILFVLDNTSNWSRESQQWPAETQGQSEVEAILDVLSSLDSQDKNVNIAILEFTTLGTANEDGGYVRFDLESIQTGLPRLEATLTEIRNNINDPIEKRNSNSSYGNLASDIYAYLSGEAQSFSGAGTPPEQADEDAYVTPYSRFRSPLTEADLCSDTYVVFISNPDSNGPEVDTDANSDQLKALYSAIGESLSVGLAGDSGVGMSMPEYEEVQGNQNSSDLDDLGFSLSCFQNSNECDDLINGKEGEVEPIASACTVNENCFCSQVSQTGSCSQGKQFQVVKPASGDPVGYGPTGDSIDGGDYNFDDWTKFLHDFGVPVTVPGENGEPDTEVRIPITTYTVDVFNAQPSEVHSSLMDNAAKVGGGKRFQATTAEELRTALGRVVGEIIDINTSFAAVTLPLSATNRAQAENKVFVGMFRPDAKRKPRWLGNLKQYQLAVFDRRADGTGGQVKLADAALEEAINPDTGFAQACATSFWTEDTSAVAKDAEGGTGPYFDGLEMEPSPTSECLAEFRGDKSLLSDSPDGAFVEKGGVAQRVRDQASRVILTLSDTNQLEGLSTNHFREPVLFHYASGGDRTIANSAGLKGGDLLVPDGNGGYGENEDLRDPEVMPYEGRRPTVHGDIVHSRPLTITYGPKDSGSGSDFRVFYGANDGLFRSIDPETGEEDWAFIAPEHREGIERLYANTPTINYFGLDASQSTDIGAEPKRYFFDGSTGVFTRYDAQNELEEAYIYLTMRRGGRMIYALDVSPVSGNGVPPTQPRFLWGQGCDADSCTTGFERIGQTWSTPTLGFVRGYVGDSPATAARPNPVLLVGGGWDECLDIDASTFSGCTTGNFVYVLDGATGEMLRAFETEAPVVTEIESLDIDYDGFVDFAYAADAAGNLYRVTFSSISAGAINQSESLGVSEWSLIRIASSNRSGVRFMNQPIVAEVGDKVLVAIGSGDRERPLKENYPYRESVDNRFYLFIDRPFEAAVDVVDLDAMLNAAAGLSGDLDEEGRPDSILNYAGWYLDLPDQGEQIVNQAAIGGGYVFFNSFQAEGSTKGFCRDLGTAKSYRVPLFAPTAVEGEEFGEGVPIPPIIVTVQLDSGDASCSDNCGPGQITNDVVTVIIGLEGFEVLDITPQPLPRIREGYRVEDIDRL